MRGIVFSGNLGLQAEKSSDQIKKKTCSRFTHISRLFYYDDFFWYEEKQNVKNYYFKT